jgi:hypothetical protein
VPPDVIDKRRFGDVVGRKDEGEMGIDDVEVEPIVLAAHGLDPREVVVGEGRVSHDGKSHSAQFGVGERTISSGRPIENGE